MNKIDMRIALMFNKFNSNLFRGTLLTNIVNRVLNQVNPYWIYDLWVKSESSSKKVKHKLILKRLKALGLPRSLDFNDESTASLNLNIVSETNELELRFFINYLNFKGYLRESNILLNAYLDIIQKCSFQTLELIN